MILGNFNIFSLVLFFVLLLLGSVIFWGFYKNNSNKISIIFLFVTFFLLIINIFEIKGGINTGFENIEGGKIVFVLDVSTSMEVIDVRDSGSTISRLSASKKIIENYLSKNSNNQYGLMIFAGETEEVLPFTSDLDIYNTILYGVNNTNISKVGTNLDSVFSNLGHYFVGDKQGGLAVIFSDLGEDEIQVNQDQIQELKNRGVKVLLVGVGSKTGGKIPIGKDFFGGLIYKSYNGYEVISKLNTDVLKKLAKNINVDYTILDNISDFGSISRYITKNINLVDIKKSINNRIDLTRFFIFVSFVFFILFLISENFIGLWRKK